MDPSAAKKRSAERVDGDSDLPEQQRRLEQRIELNRALSEPADVDDSYSADDEDEGEALAALLAAADAVKEEKAGAPKPAADAALLALANGVGKTAPSPAVPEAASSTALVVVEDDVASTLRTSKTTQRSAKKQEAVVKQLKPIDHSSIAYPAFEKEFYIEPSDISAMTDEEVKTALKELDGAKVKGKNPPKPMKTWNGIGLNEEVFRVLHDRNYPLPFAVQSLAIPALMSGRDLLVTAKTGSGKTLAYVLPLVRHVQNQSRCGSNEGPIGLIVSPTQELAQQIVSMAIPFCKASGLRLVSAIGGTSMQDQIPAVKRGCDVMVATANRLYDLMIANNESVMNLRRVTMVVIDEADRMFDEGFKPYVEVFMKNIRPDRQVALISATMPIEVQQAAKRFLKSPVSITVGGRPSPSSNVAQSVNFFDEHPATSDANDRFKDQRFRRLLGILGDEIDSPCDRCVLIFVQRKEDCDMLFAGLSSYGYRGLIGTLYSGMEAVDRELALKQFAPNMRPILIASGLAERGIDVFDLALVVNYDCPNHYEAYIQRIGRTGRAGRKGRAITFFVRGADDPMAQDLLLGLEDSGNEVPQELNDIKDVYVAKHPNAKSNFRKGYGAARTFKHGSKEERKRFREHAAENGWGADLSDDSFSSDSSEEVDSDAEVAEKRKDPKIFAETAESDQQPQQEERSLVSYSNEGALVLSTKQEDRVAKALAFAQMATDTALGTTTTQIFRSEYPVNDLGDNARKFITRREFLREVEEATKTRVDIKGQYFPPRTKRIPEGKQKLFLEIRGESDIAVRKVFRMLEEKLGELESRAVKRGSAFGAAPVL